MESAVPVAGFIIRERIYARVMYLCYDLRYYTARCTGFDGVIMLVRDPVEDRVIEIWNAFL